MLLSELIPWQELEEAIAATMRSVTWRILGQLVVVSTRRHDMASQGSPQGEDRSPLVKQDPHSDRDCSRALGGVFQNQPCLLLGHSGE